MQTLFTLPEEDKRLIQESMACVLAGRQEILFAYLFGSFVHDPGFHDVDVGIYLREEDFAALRMRDAFDFETSLAVALEKTVPYPVDVKVLNQAPVALGHAVTNGRVLLSRDEATRLAWVEGIWGRYLDMAYFFRSSLLDLLGAGQA